MLKILNEVIQNIREKEKNALIVLKGFNDEIFKIVIVIFFMYIKYFTVSIFNVIYNILFITKII